MPTGVGSIWPMLGARTAASRNSIEMRVGERLWAATAVAAALAAIAVVLVTSAAALADPAGKVDVFAGTMPGPRTFGGGHDYPGAALPFGMVQWSPDTTPAAPHSGGYDHRDNHVRGFSLTHLSGAGCALYGQTT